MTSTREQGLIRCWELLDRIAGQVQQLRAELHDQPDVTDAATAAAALELAVERTLNEVLAAGWPASDHCEEER